MIQISYHKSILGDAKRAFSKIGYHSNWFKQDYAFSDFYASTTPQRNIHLGVFGQDPPDYRSSCFGLQFAQPGESIEEVIKHVRAFGAPQLFYVSEATVERWGIRMDGGALIEVTPTAKIAQLITDHAQEWNPSAVLRAKAGFVRPDPRNRDFVDLGLLPALEHEAATKIDELVRLTCSLAEDHYKDQQSNLNIQKLFSLIFQLLVGKLLVDRGIPTTPAIDFNNVQSVLAAVRNHYPAHDHDVLRHLQLAKTDTAKIAHAIGNSFSFANLSAETLTYVYENTFVSASSRKDLGIHSTPSYIADYILSQMPIEDIEQQLWNVLDPTCGHGIFLIAAMRRMRALLPSDWGPKQRHAFFVKRLHGVDMELFSLEVAKLCLMLADFPEANGWDLQNHDIFSGNFLEGISETATIVVGNPPFEALEGIKPLRRKPAELLSRMLPKLPAGGLTGMVLPRAFLDGKEYRKERGQLFEAFDLLSVTALPDRIFTYSDAETAIVIARKGARRAAQFYYREVLDADREKFRYMQAISWEDSVSMDFWTANQGDLLAVPRLRQVWEHLAHLPRIADVAAIRTGIRYRSGANEASCYSSRAGVSWKRGIENVDDSFMQYVCNGQRYFSLDEELHQNSAWKYDWDREKVIVPASRNSRGPWRYAAALDEDGLCISRRFYAIWSREENKYLSAAVLTAILNSPIAMAYAYTHSFQKDIRVSTYGNIPVPKLNSLKRQAQALENLVREYRSIVKNSSVDKTTARRLLLQIDAEILKLYDLPPRLERVLLDLFWGHNRRVSFPFTGYIPPTYIPAIPLHIYISPAFNEARASNVLDELPKVISPDTIDFLRSLEDNAL